MSSEVYKSEQALFFLDYLYTVDENITFSLYIKSMRFSGEYKFCLYYSRITEIIFTLELMNRKLQGEVSINDLDSDSFVLLKFENDGFFVSGRIGASYDEQFMVFKFKADQTLISLLINNLNEALEKPETMF